MLSISYCAFCVDCSACYHLSTAHAVSFNKELSRPLRLRELVLCAAASVRDEVNCVPSACCYSRRYVCDTTDKLEVTEVQWSFVLCDRRQLALFNRPACKKNVDSFQPFIKAQNKHTLASTSA